RQAADDARQLGRRDAAWPGPGQYPRLRANTDEGWLPRLALRRAGSRQPGAALGGYRSGHPLLAAMPRRVIESCALSVVRSKELRTTDYGLWTMVHGALFQVSLVSRSRGREPAS